MQSQNHLPKWWQLYLIFPSMVLLFAVDSRLNISASGHQFVQIGILGLILSFVYIWLIANTSALSRMDQKRNGGRITGISYQQENKLPPKNEIYTDFQSGNSYTGAHSNIRVFKESEELGYSFPEDVRQQTEKE